MSSSSLSPAHLWHQGTTECDQMHCPVSCQSHHMSLIDSQQQCHEAVIHLTAIHLLQNNVSVGMFSSAETIKQFQAWTACYCNIKFITCITATDLTSERSSPGLTRRLNAHSCSTLSSLNTFNSDKTCNTKQHEYRSQWNYSGRKHTVHIQCKGHLIWSLLYVYLRYVVSSELCWKDFLVSYKLLHTLQYMAINRYH